jgi:glycosyltransferase involved in cell wall biosynthesis
MRRVVSLTPLAADRDSRTFKQAASVARMGFESVLVEDQESRLERGRLPFALRTVATTPRRSASRAGRLLANFTNQHAPELYQAVLRLWHYGPVTARSVPSASLYYLHSPLQYPAMLLRGRRTPFVYDAHDFYPADRTDELWDRLVTWLERRCVRDAAEVVTVTEGCAGLIEDFFGRRPVVLPNVHDPRIDEPPPEDLRTALGLGTDAFLLVMAGNAKPGTAVEEALTALAELPERVHMAFVGGGWDAYADRLVARGLTSRVHLRPPVPPGQIAPLIRTADAAVILYFALTDDYLHALPNRLFLPISAGLPLVYPSALREMRALAETHGLGIGFDPHDPRSLVEAIRRLLDDDAEFARYRENARRAGQELTWERQEPRLRAIIDASLNGAAAAGGPG